MSHVSPYGIDGLGQVTGGAVEEMLTGAVPPNGILIERLFGLEV
jgi:hypothetical protein